MEGDLLLDKLAVAEELIMLIYTLLAVTKIY